MSKYTSFAKNVGVLTLANFSTKILSFLLVPLYTSVLSTSDYGTYDLVLNTVNVLIPLLTFNIVDAVLRFSIGNTSDTDKIIDVGLRYFLLSLALIVLLLGINAGLGFSKEIESLSVYIVLMFATQALSQILLYYARGLNRFSDVAISSVISSVTIIGLNILFLLIFQLGLIGYFWANILGPFAQILYLSIRLKLRGVNVIDIDKRLEKEMVAYSRPLIVNSIAWWVNNVSDRYIVTFICGVAVNGVYSVASKIPSILSIFQTIIGQAWTISAVDEFDPEDKSGFFSKMYALYNCLMVLMCSVIIALDIPLAHFLYAKDFFDAWKYVPFLTISIVFGALAGYIGGILAAVKDSNQFAKTSVAGALFNIALNIVLVPFIGPLGSSIATAACYWLTWYLRLRIMGEYIHLRLKLFRDAISYVFLVVQSVLLILLFHDAVICFGIQFVCILIQVMLMRSEVGMAFSKVVNKVRSK